MYCKEVTNYELSRLKPSISINPNTTKEKLIPFKLQEFSISECQEAIDHFNSVIDFDLYQESIRNDPSKPKIIYKEGYRPSQEELIFIENERIMCKWSEPYWKDRYYKISNHENKFVQFSPNVPQRINRKIRARAQKLRRAINKITLKARQLGETTDEIGTKIQRILYFGDVKALVASKDMDSTLKMSRIFTDAVALLPYWNRAFVSEYQTRKYWLYDNNSLLDFGWGTQDSLGRGSTYTVGHFSEIAMYVNPVEAIEDAYLNAIHESIWTLITLEGTAESRDDWFHKIWKNLVSQQERGTTSFITRFYPWCLRDDIKPTETWIRGRAEAFSLWQPTTETLAHARKVESYIRQDSDLRTELPNWKMSREKMFWYEVSKTEAKNKNQLQNFLKEQPSDPEEAFQHAGHSIYSVETLIYLNDKAQERIPEVYKLRGDSNEINPEFFPTSEDIKPDGKVIRIRADWNQSIAFSDYELVECKFEGWANFNPINKFLIWEHPIRGADYGFGIDNSAGLGLNVSDDAVIIGIKKGTIEYKDKQVVELASPEMSQAVMWPFLMAIATYFSPEYQALLAIEINNGTELLNIMLNRGWFNHHQMMDRTKIGQGESKVRKLGFETNRQTRPDLVNQVNAFINGNWIDLYSVPLIQELNDLEVKTTVSSELGQRKDKIAGKKDNRFMALGMALYSLHRDEILGLQKAAWNERIANENSIVELQEMPSGYYEWEKAIEFGNHRPYNPMEGETGLEDVFEIY